MSTPSQTDERLREAAAWFARLRSDDASESDHLDWRAWLQRDPANGEAFSRIEQRWKLTDALRGRALIEFQVEEPPASALTRPGLFARHRSLWLSGAAAVLLLTCTLALMNLYSTATYTTAVGSQERLVLADDSVISLNTDSALRVSITPFRRALALDQGEAYFDVTSEPLRPFIVATPELKVRTLGTQFNVQRLATRTRVTVLEGRVAVLINRPWAGVTDTEPTIVEAGQEAVFEPGTAIRVGQAQSAARIEAWKRGQILLSRSTLQEAATEIARYVPVELHVDPRVANLTISGTFQVNDAEVALAAIERALPIRVRRVAPRQINIEYAEDR